MADATIAAVAGGRHDRGAASDRRPGTIHRLATGAVLRRLEGLERGRLLVRLPDGRAIDAGPGEAGPAAELEVHDWSFFARLALGGDLGAGESYMDGEWSTPDLVALARLFLANEAALGLGGGRLLPSRIRDRIQHALRSNTRRRAPRNIRAHYDLGNDFYRLWLDETMTYSAALFGPAGDSLADAQRRKYRRLAELAGIRPGARVLEIGCGWGGFAEVATSELDCHVTGVTLSPAQATWARDRLAAAGLSDNADIRVVDYRDVTGRFDAIVSVEMLEAVGHRFLPRFFAACERLLAPGGRVALQSITIPDQLYDQYRRGTDWIRKHIFPGGHLPSLGALQTAMARSSSLVVRRVDDIAPHYAATLEKWRDRFLASRPEILALGFGERFVRMWDFYLASCAAAFAHRKLGSLQLSLARVGDGSTTTFGGDSP